MVYDIHSLFGYSNVITAPSPALSGTSLVVATGDGANFAVGQNITVWPQNVVPTKAVAEICRITAIAGDTLTITRAQEGSTAKSIAVGWQVANTITPKLFTDMESNLTRIATKVVAPAGSANAADYYTTGVADDVQIQAAINAVSAAGGGVVYIKEGTYNIRNNNANGFAQPTYAPYVGMTVPSNVSIIGAGRAKTILTLSSYVAGTNDRFVMFCNTAAGQTDIQIENLSIILPAFQVGAGAFWGHATEFSGTKRVILRNLYIQNGGWRFDGNVVTFNATTKELATDCKDLLVDNVIVEQVLGSCGLFSTKNVLLNNNVIRQPHDDPIIISNSGQRLRFINNYIDGDGTTNAAASGGFYFLNNGTVAADPYTMSDIVLIGNQIHSLISGNGIIFAGSTGSRDVSILGNHITNNPGVGILVIQAMQNCRIIGNNLIYNKASSGYLGGINISTVNAGDIIKNINISNNIVADNQTYGIYVASVGATATLQNITIGGNEIYDDQGVVTQTQGITVLANNATLTNIVLNLNNVHDTTTPYTFTPGTGSIGGGSLYLVSGALTYRGGNGTVTTVAVA